MPHSDSKIDLKLVIVNELIKKISNILKTNINLYFMDNAVNIQKVENKCEELSELKIY